MCTGSDLPSIPISSLFEDFCLPDYQASAKQQFEAALCPPGKLEMQLPIRFRDGSSQWLVFKGFTLFDNDGHTPTRVLGTVNDVTSSLRDAHEAEQSKSKTLFLSALSHELRKYEDEED